MVELRKSNILGPKHGGDGVILASVICMTCAVHIIQVSGKRARGLTTDLNDIDRARHTND